MTDAERPSERAIREALARTIVDESIPLVQLIHGYTYISVDGQHVRLRPKWVRHVARQLMQVADEVEKQP